MARIVLHEVGPRDGLQMEKQVVPLEKKEAWLRSLLESGVDIIQVGSFVHPEKVPQMADTDRLFAELGKPAGVVFSALVLNEKGLERGLAWDDPVVGVPWPTLDIDYILSAKDQKYPGLDGIQA